MICTIWKSQTVIESDLLKYLFIWFSEKYISQTIPATWYTEYQLNAVIKGTLKWCTIYIYFPCMREVKCMKICSPKTKLYFTRASPEGDMTKRNECFIPLPILILTSKHKILINIIFFFTICFITKYNIHNNNQYQIWNIYLFVLYHLFLN